MKNLMAKLKSANYKQFFLNHGEKIGLGGVGVIAVASLAMTTWSANISLTPEDMEKQAANVDESLKKKIWPDEEKSAFLPLQLADNELALAVTPLQLPAFDWKIDMSRKLYERIRPAGEIEWLPPIELRAVFDNAPMGVAVALSQQSKPEESTTKKPAKKGGKKTDSSGESLLGESEGGMGAGFATSAGEQVEGVRFAVVTGAVPTFEQQKRLYKGLHLNSLVEAGQMLPELYSDFKIERQRAVPGPDPWVGPWRELDIENSVRRIEEASDVDLELVHPKYTSPIFTSVLPHRLDTDWWSPETAGHIRVPTLTEDEQEEENRKTLAARDVAGPEADGVRKKKGLGRISLDVNGVRNQAENVDDGKAYDESLKKRGGGKEKSTKQKSGSTAAAGGGGRGGSRGMTPPPTVNTGGRGATMSSSGSRGMVPPMAGAPGAGNMSSMGSGGPGGMRMPRSGIDGGMGAGMTMGAMPGNTDEFNAGYSLFRYIDFDVEPGECYRYRVKFEMANPNFGSDFVDSPSVAEGETRWSNWSEPSAPVVIAKDVNYGLKGIVTTPAKGNRVDGATLSVVQFDPKQGTLLSDAYKVGYGFFISKVMKSQRLNIVTQSLDDAEVTFYSKDILLDSLGCPNLSSQVQADLKLDTRQFNSLKKGGEIDLAVTVDRFGEIIELDASSNLKLQPALNKVKDERAEAKEAKEADRLAQKKQDKDEAGATTGKRRRGRRGSGGGANRAKSMGSGSMMPMGMPGMNGSSGSSKSSR